MCHAAEPVWAGIQRPPKGVMLDTPARIRAHAREIAVSAGMEQRHAALQHHRHDAGGTRDDCLWFASNR